MAKQQYYNDPQFRWNFMPPQLDQNNPISKYPRQPNWKQSCQTNNRYKTIPQYEPQRDPWTRPLTEITRESADADQSKFAWPTTCEMAGPASIRHLYSGPNHYPNMYRQRPVGTMYGADLGELGFGGKRETYHFKAYPLTHRYAREIIQYRGDVLPEPNIKSWQENPVVLSTSDWGSWGQIAH